MAALTAVLTVACASKPPANDPDAMAAFEDTNDRLEPFNRAMFGVDNALDTVLIRPVAWTYREIVPEPGRRGVTNFLRNLRSPITLINDLLQGEGERAGTTVGRFMMNTTVGLLGFVDVATDAGMPYHYEDFGQTLARWGVQEGTYLYLPVIGPTGVRDGFGLAVDSFAFDPVAWYSYADNPSWHQWAYFSALLIDLKASTMSTTDELRKSSIDYYAALRAAYQQNRAKEIRNGAPAPLPPMNGEDGEDPFAGTTLRGNIAAR
ncbi:MAG: VacJ family lipoprotein [Rhodobacteraceae bacterium]|nr:VacJ family lipoprotein [Paracoccaceae bacterium]